MSADGRDVNLARAMRALADMEASAETPPRVEAAVMAHWARRSRAKAGRARAGRFIRGAATTAAGITLVGALMWSRGANESAVVPTPPPTPDAAEENLTRFTTVAVVGEPLQAGEPLRVVRMRVARAVLGELGISSASRADGNDDSVDIDVLVGEDGVARGVRVPIREL